MGADTKIEWTDSSWTPIRARNRATGKVGWHCEHDTTGCEFCYAESMNKRLGTGLPFKPGHRKDIEIFLDEEMLLAPLRWKRPRMIFVCSMTDAFAEFVKDEWLDKLFAVMALCPQHTFQVLTKRAERMREYFDIGVSPHSTPMRLMKIEDAMTRFEAGKVGPQISVNGFPLPNVWLGVSCERQQEADERIPHLLLTPAAIRFVSAEPLLGEILLKNIAPHRNSAGDKITWLDSLTGERVERKQSPMFDRGAHAEINVLETGPKLDWVIVGGESGPHARVMDPRWALWLRDTCEENGTAFFFKQWGEWAPPNQYDLAPADRVWKIENMFRVGKKAAGRLLDGREHNAFPVIDSSASRSGLSSPENKTAEATPS